MHVRFFVLLAALFQIAPISAATCEDNFHVPGGLSKLTPDVAERLKMAIKYYRRGDPRAGAEMARLVAATSVPYFGAYLPDRDASDRDELVQQLVLDMLRVVPTSTMNLDNLMRNIRQRAWKMVQFELKRDLQQEQILSDLGTEGIEFAFEPTDSKDEISAAIEAALRRLTPLQEYTVREKFGLPQRFNKPYGASDHRAARSARWVLARTSLQELLSESILRSP